MSIITLKLSTSFSGMVGYGNIFKCRVIEVVEGDFNEDEINVIILLEDKDKADFISAHQAPDEVLIEFKKRKENEPNSLMPITGFVDKQKTSWEIIKFEVFK